MALAKVADENGFRVEMIYRNVEEALDLRRVEIHGKHSVDAGGGEQIGDQLGGDRHAWLVFAVLSGIAEKRHHRGDPLRAGAAGGVHHDQELHQIVISRRTAWLDDENIGAADVFVNFHFRFTIRKRGDVDVGKWLAKAFGNAFGKPAVSGSTDDFHGQNNDKRPSGRIIDSGRTVGNTLLVIRPSLAPTDVIQSIRAD